MLARVLQMILCGMVLAACQSAPEPAPFERYFQKARTIRLSGEVLINGKIRSLDVNKRGDLLVTDIGHAYLFDRDGALKRVLDPTPCHPGVQMRPISAHFRPDGKIFMLNAGDGAFGFLFQKDGSCWQAAPRDFRPPSSLAFGPEGHIYGHYVRPSAESSRVKIMTGEGALERSFRIPASEYNNVDIRVGDQGSMVSVGENLYHALPSRSAIHLYDTTGKLVHVIDNPPSYYRPVKTHIPGQFENIGQAVEKTRPIYEESTIVHSLYALDEHRLLVQYKDHNRYGIDVLNRSEKRLIEGPITVGLGEQIRQARGGEVYRIVQPESLAQGKVLNPSVEVYRFER